MTKEKIDKRIQKAYAQRDIYKEKLSRVQQEIKELEEQRQIADEAEVLGLIKKYKISSGQLQLLNALNEEEILQFLEQKEREKIENEEKIN